MRASRSHALGVMGAGVCLNASIVSGLSIYLDCFDMHLCPYFWDRLSSAFTLIFIALYITYRLVIAEIHSAVFRILKV